MTEAMDLLGYEYTSENRLLPSYPRLESCD